MTELTEELERRCMKKYSEKVRGSGGECAIVDVRQRGADTSDALSDMHRERARRRGAGVRNGIGRREDIRRRRVNRLVLMGCEGAALYACMMLSARK